METNTHLADELLVGLWVTVRTECLLQESQKHRDDDACLESLPEADEED